MSSGALFGNNASRGSSKHLVECKAGKMNVKGKMVCPDLRKGQLYVHQAEDSLMHFCWKDRTTGVVEDDLIIFPDDCEYKLVPECKTGRVYLLKFKSSNRRFFFWLQDLKTDKDEENCRKINEYLNNPPSLGSQRSVANPEGDLQNLLNNMSQQQLIQLFGGGNIGSIGSIGNLLGSINRSQGGNARISTTSSSSPVTTSVPRPPAAQTPVPTTMTESSKPAGNKATSSRSSTASSPNSSSASSTATVSGVSSKNSGNKIQLSDLQNFLSEMTIPAGGEPIVEKGVASELTSAISKSVTTSESLERAVSPHLPAGDSLGTTLSTPQFSQALSMFWSALQSGQAGPVVQQFGLGSDAVNAAATGNIEQFVNALESEAKSNPGPATSQGAKDAPEQAPAEAQKRPSTEKKDDSNDDEGMALD